MILIHHAVHRPRPAGPRIFSTGPPASPPSGFWGSADPELFPRQLFLVLVPSTLTFSALISTSLVVNLVDSPVPPPPALMAWWTSLIASPLAAELSADSLDLLAASLDFRAANRATMIEATNVTIGVIAAAPPSGYSLGRNRIAVIAPRPRMTAPPVIDVLSFTGWIPSQAAGL